MVQYGATCRAWLKRGDALHPALTRGPPRSLPGMPCGVAPLRIRLTTYPASWCEHGAARATRSEPWLQRCISVAPFSLTEASLRGHSLISILTCRSFARSAGPAAMTARSSWIGRAYRSVTPPCEYPGPTGGEAGHVFSVFRSAGVHRDSRAPSAFPCGAPSTSRQLCTLLADLEVSRAELSARNGCDLRAAGRD